MKEEGGPDLAPSGQCLPGCPLSTCEEYGLQGKEKCGSWAEGDIFLLKRQGKWGPNVTCEDGGNLEMNE